MVSEMNSCLNKIEIKERHNSYVVVKILSDNMKLSEIFSMIENKKELMKIKEYGLSQTTLQQVLLNSFNRYSLILSL